jgi:hypothetical protein
MGGKNMIINQSQVAMSSQRTFIRRQTDTFTAQMEKVEPKKGGFIDLITGRNKVSEDNKLSDEDSTFMKFKTMNYLFRLLFFKQMGGSTDSLE